MIKVLIDKFILSHNYNDNKVRSRYTLLTGVLGLILNSFLFGIKFLVGLLVGSIALIADAVNNLSDSLSSIITIITSKVSQIDPDDEHPFGHGRIEYIATLIIAFIILIVGFEVIKEAFSKIFTYSKPVFSIFSIIVSIIAILVKLWMFSYNRYIGSTINSKVNLALAYDALSDILSSSVILLSIIAGSYTSLPLDAIAGLFVGLYITYSGFRLVKETIDLLLGHAPDSEVFEEVKGIILESKMIEVVNDVKLHDYGPGMIVGTAHVGIDATKTIAESHFEIDRIESKIKDIMGVEIVIHIDPIIKKSNFWGSHHN